MDLVDFFRVLQPVGLSGLLVLVDRGPEVIEILKNFHLLVVGARFERALAFFELLSRVNHRQAPCNT